MQVIIAGRTIQLFHGDITDQRVDAIVNAANSQLAGGGGVDGAIHRAGGPEIMRQTKHDYPKGCRTGSAVISGAGDLSARFVIHAVGPIWRGGNQDEAILLASAYRSCLNLAAEHGCKAVAFPSLSTGAYRYPMESAARVALQTVIDFLNEGGDVDSVRFVLFSEDAFQVFSTALAELT